MASALCLMGGSVGSMVLPLLLTWLIELYTIRGALLVLAAIELHLLILPLLLRSTRAPVEEKCDVVVLEKGRETRPAHRGEVNVAFENTESKKDILKLTTGTEQSVEENEQIPGASDKSYSSQLKNGISTEKGAESPQEVTGNVILTSIKYISETHNTSTVKSDELSQAEDTGKRESKDESCSYFKTFFGVQFLSVLLFYMTFVYGFYGFIAYIPAYMEEYEITKSEQSFILTISASTNLAGRLLSGALGNLNCVSIYIFTVVMNLMSGFCLMFLPMLLSYVSKMGVFASMAAVHGLGGGVGIYQMQMAVDSVGVKRSGTAVGLLGLAFCTGNSCPPLVFGKV